MKYAKHLIAALLLLSAWALPSSGYTDTTQCVVLLHGLSRTDYSMKRLERDLEAHGYATANVHYNSRRYTIEEIASAAIESGMARCHEGHPVSQIHFVTHSLGGILVRYYLANRQIDNLGRVVMLAPPNQGSEIIDVFGRVPGFELFAGEPALQLGTDEDSLPQSLPPVDFELGVIAGTRSLSPIFSLTLPDRDDGKVTVENTKIEGMQDFIEVPYSHTFIMQRQAVHDQVRHFLAEGHFIHPDENTGL